MSIWQSIGLPAEAWVVLFTLGAALVLTSFFQGADFGILKTPTVPPERRKTVLLSGICICSVLIAATVPFLPKRPDERKQQTISVDPGTNVDIRLSGKSMSSDDPRSNFDRLRPVGANGDALFVFETNELGRFEFGPEDLQKMSAVLAQDEVQLARKDRSALTMSEDRLAALALARAAFKLHDYSNASLFYDYALSDLDADGEDYQSIHGMLTASLYGAGEHRKGLKFICEQYKKNPVRSSPFRHAVHAHIRRIALTESYISAETTIERLRAEFGCTFDDFTVAWIPIPLKFMEYLETGQRVAIQLDDVDKAQIRKYVHAKAPFHDYLLLLDGGERNYRAIVELFPGSHVFNLALKELAIQADAAKDTTYLARFVKGFPDDPIVSKLLLGAARSIYKSQSDTTLASFESLFEGTVRLVENEEVVDLMFKDGPRKLAIELAEAYLANNSKGPNALNAAGIVLAARLKEDSSDTKELSKLTAIMQDGTRESRRKVLVLEFRRHCEVNKTEFENLEFGQVFKRLAQTHRDFSRFESNGFYEVSTWLDTSGLRSKIPCSKSFGSGDAKIAGSDMLIVSEYLEDLQGAFDRGDYDAQSKFAVSLHQCHMQRLTGTARRMGGVCGALTRVLPRSTSFGYAVSALHERVYKSNPERHFRHLYLGAMAERRNRKFEAYRERMSDFILLHSDTHLIDDANTELGWYYLQTKDLGLAEKYLRRVLDSYEHLNAYDNALYWLEKVNEAKADVPASLKNSAELATYLATRRSIEKITGTHAELRARTPGFLEPVFRSDQTEKAIVDDILAPVVEK